MKNLIKTLFLVLITTICISCNKENTTKETVMTFYIETVNFPPDIETAFKEEVCNKYTSQYTNDIFNFKDTLPTFNENSFHISKFIDGKDFPESNFIDGLYKIRITYLNETNIEDHGYSIETFKSEDAGKWLRIHNMGFTSFRMEKGDSINVNNAVLWMKDSMIIGVYK